MSGFKLRKDGVETVCAFCGARLLLGFVDDGTEHGEPVGIHTLPMCEKFEKTELVDFVIENRRKMGLPDPGGFEN